MSASPQFPCPHCGARSFERHPVAVELNHADALAHLSTCASCGENYLATVHTDSDGMRVETWDYYLERRPALRRVRTYRPRGRFGEFQESAQQFFVGGLRASETLWRAELAIHRASPSALLDDYVCTVQPADETPLTQRCAPGPTPSAPPRMVPLSLPSATLSAAGLPTRLPPRPA